VMVVVGIAHRSEVDVFDTYVGTTAGAVHGLLAHLLERAMDHDWVEWSCLTTERRRSER